MGPNSRQPKKLKVKVRGFYIATLTQLTSTALHSRQATGKNEEQKVERRCVTAAPGEPYDPTQTHTQLNVPVTAHKDLTPSQSWYQIILLGDRSK